MSEPQKTLEQISKEFLDTAINAYENGKDGHRAAEEYIKRIGDDAVYSLLKQTEKAPEYEKLKKDEVLARMRLFNLLFDMVTDDKKPGSLHNVNYFRRI